MRWNPSGRRGSKPDRMGSGRAAVARTRLALSIRHAKALGPGVYGRLTPTWRRRSTGSTTLTCSRQSAAFPVAGRFAAGVRGGGFGGEDTTEGVCFSPLLLKRALHGREEPAGVRYVTAGAQAGDTKANSPVLVRYADDLVVLCHSQEQAQQIKARLTEWLTPRGLAFNEDKTKIVHLSQGFDFLGFNVRRYGRKLLIKPGKAAIRRVRERLAAEMRTLRGSNAMAVIARLNPITPGSSRGASLLRDVA